LADLPTLDLEIQVHKILVKAFASSDELQQLMSEEKNPLEGDPFENVTNNIEILRNQPQHETLMEAMMTKASTPLYEGSSTSILLAILLLSLRVVHGVSNVFMDELFSLLQRSC